VIDNLPDHADLARRALAARSGEPVTFTVADGRQSAELVILLVQGHD
jgi:hypothetical protein